jgi:hypothetical protein
MAKLTESKLRKIIKEEVEKSSGKEGKPLSDKIFRRAQNNNKLYVIGLEGVEDIYNDPNSIDQYEYSEREAFSSTFYAGYLDIDIVIPRKSYESPSASPGWYGFEKNIYSNVVYGESYVNNKMTSFNSKEEVFSYMRNMFDMIDPDPEDYDDNEY